MFSWPAAIAVCLAVSAAAVLILAIKKDQIGAVIAAVALTVFFAGYVFGMMAVSFL